MFKKEAFRQGYIEGIKLSERQMEKKAFDLGEIGATSLLLMAGIPILGGIGTATLHHGLLDRDYKQETKQLLRRYKIKALEERNKQLMKDIEGFGKERL